MRAFSVANLPTRAAAILLLAFSLLLAASPEAFAKKARPNQVPPAAELNPDASPALAVVLSLIAPGLGHIFYDDQQGGSAFLVACALTWAIYLAVVLGLTALVWLVVIFLEVMFFFIFLPCIALSGETYEVGEAAADAAGVTFRYTAGIGGVVALSVHLIVGAVAAVDIVRKIQAAQEKKTADAELLPDSRPLRPVNLLGY